MRSMKSMATVREMVPGHIREGFLGNINLCMVGI